MRKTWTGPLARVEDPTDDHRVFSRDGFTHRPFPLALLWQPKTGTAHSGAVVVGRILGGQVGDDDVFQAHGDWFDPAVVPESAQAQELSEGGVIGPSVDLSSYTVEVDTTGEKPLLRYPHAKFASATLVPITAFEALRLDNGVPEAAAFVVNPSGWSGLPIGDRNLEFNADAAIQRILAWAGGDAKKAAGAFLWRSADASPLARDGYRLPVGDIVDGKLTVIYHAIYAAAALLSGGHGGLPDIPDPEKEAMRRAISNIYGAMAKQFGDPSLKAPWDKGARAEKGMSTMDDDMDLAHLTAAGGPVAPPRTWFDNPGLSAPTQLRVEQDGRVFGHLATWGTCHIAPHFTACVTPPRSETDYAYFRTGEIVADNDEFVPVGTITLGTGHADTRLGLIPAVDHYDRTGSVAAVVNVGEDEHGIWVAGSLVGDLSDVRAAELRRSPLSGDWRRVGGNLELVAALAVNTPGFPIARVDGTRQFALVAAGVVSPQDRANGPEATPLAIDEERPSLMNLAEVAREAVAQMRAEENRQERLAILLAADQHQRAVRLQRLMGQDA